VPSPDPRFAPPSPFARLVAAHAASAAGDGCVVAALAGSLFFSQPTGQAREKILLYLLITLAPFAVVAPVLGPALDRVGGGRRLGLVLTLAARTLLALLMSRYVTSVAFYPLAFGMLVMQKGYSVAKSSLVPGLVSNEGELIKANSRLNIMSTVAGAIGAAPAFGIHEGFGSKWSLLLAAVVYAGATVLALKIPKVQAEQTRAEARAAREELHQPSILLAGSVIAALRGCVGFLLFFMLFALKDDKLALGFAGGCYTGGLFLGNVLAPSLRERLREESIIASSMVVAAALGLIGAVGGGTLGFALALLGLGLGASAGKVGFDSLLQRDGPDAARGRAFAMYESRFQLTWVVGGLIGLIPVAHQAGLLGLAMVLLFAATSYGLALQTARRRGTYRTRLLPDSVDRKLRDARETAWQRVRAVAARRTRRRPPPGEPASEPSRPPPPPPPAHQRPAPGEADTVPG